MNFTKRLIEKTLTDYENLVELADRYVEEAYPNTRRGAIKFEYGYVYEYVNTSCHCHPEMEWSQRGSVEDFSAWVQKKNLQLKPKYYTVKP